MPVRFVVTPHPAVPVATPKPLQKAQDCLEATWGRKSKTTCAELLQSSLQAPAHWPATQSFDALRSGSVSTNADADASAGRYLSSFPKRTQTAWNLYAHLRPQANGFVDAVVEAYNHHHHLIIRPDDVWLVILSQFNLYVNANSEALREYFVAHEGKKELVVEAVGTRYTVDFGSLAKQMTDEIDKNVLDKELKYWILPDFTTTTYNDTVTSAVMMMSTLKSYFSYTMRLRCGIPSVTLEGEKEDWEKLLARIDRLKIFGREPEAWAAMLWPILTRFIRAFDGEPGTDFWNHVCHYQRVGSGSDILGGWITVFCVWDKDGKWIESGYVDSILAQVTERSQSGSNPPPSVQSDERNRKLELDGIPYPTVSVDKIPPGYCEVDVHLDDNGQHFDCVMVSGHMSARVEGVAKDVIRPHPAWFMFIKGPDKKTGGR